MKGAAVNAQHDWSFEQAQAAQQQYQAAGHAMADPAGPLYQWAALHALDELKQRHANGDKYALMLAIRKCAQHDLLMPEWVTTGYIAGFDAVHNYRAKSWDQVFGTPLAKGKQLAAERKRRTLSAKVWTEITRRHSMGEAVDDELFASVGKKLGLGRSLAAEYYAQWKARMPAASNSAKS